MLLKGKNKLLVFALALIAGCAVESGELSEAEKRAADSLKKEQQRRKIDSLKAKSPFLVMPPDSAYTGSYIDRYPNGIVKFRGFYRQGKQHGQWLSFYPNGEAWSEMHYDKGLRHGPNITYFPNGKTRYMGTYKNDKRDSLWTYYDSTGTAVKKVTFRNDDLISQEELGRDR